MPFAFDTTYARLPERFFARVRPTPVAAPGLVLVNDALAVELGVDPAELRTPEGVARLAGNDLFPGSDPIALAYAGHQFGGFVPQLGDGRAILLGEVVGSAGRRDVQLKGAGPTPFSRRGDGRAALGPVLREYVVSEAMHALGVPTTRALAAVTTGEPVLRERALPGGVLTRIASSHLRVGTFEFFAARGDVEGLSTLLAYALARHAPDTLASAESDPERVLALLEHTIAKQSELVAWWLSLGFVHGVMNTDNVSIAGETLDYGPCAFLDGYDPTRTFSSIDQGGRYAFQNQPRMALWNLARLAEALLPLFAASGIDEKDAVARVTAPLEGFAARFATALEAKHARKLGLGAAREGDRELAESFLSLLQADRADHTATFRALAELASAEARSDLTAMIHAETILFGRFAESSEERVRAWLGGWRAAFRRRLAADGVTASARAAEMLAASPSVHPRNHAVESMIDAALEGNFAPFVRLHRALQRPYEAPSSEAEAAGLLAPPGREQWQYRTFCGT